MSSTEEIHLIREVAIRYAGARRRVPGKITRPDQVAEYLRRRARDDAREHFVAIHLDGRHRPIADSVVSIGTATASLVHPREVFQPAIALGACALLIDHHHPSGDVTPSTEWPRPAAFSASPSSTTSSGSATGPFTRSVRPTPNISRPGADRP
jgi:DNA repair protein RadC